MTDLVIKDLAGSNLTLKKINQDAYSGEYFKRVGATEYRLKVRHSQENPKQGLPMNRHNVEITATTFATDGTPPVIVQAFMVFRNPLGGVDAQAIAITDGLTAIYAANEAALMGWETDLASPS